MKTHARIIIFPDKFIEQNDDVQEAHLQGGEQRYEEVVDILIKGDVRLAIINWQDRFLHLHQLIQTPPANLSPDDREVAINSAFHDILDIWKPITDEQLANMSPQTEYFFHVLAIPKEMVKHIILKSTEIEGDNQEALEKALRKIAERGHLAVIAMNTLPSIWQEICSSVGNNLFLHDK